MNVQDELSYHIHDDLLIGEKKRNKCNILMTSMLSGNNQAVTSEYVLFISVLHGGPDIVAKFKAKSGKI